MNPHIKIPTRRTPLSPAKPDETSISPIRKKTHAPAKIKGMTQSEGKGIAENKDNLTRTLAKRRLDKSLIEAVAALVSRGLTESEACRQLNIRPKTFFNFKSTRRNDERFAELLEKFRSARIEDLISKIEHSADGVGMKQRDWRAAKFLLEVLDRQRFNTDRPVEVNVNNHPPVSITVLNEQLKRIIGNPAEVITLPASAPALLPSASKPLPASAMPVTGDDDAKADLGDGNAG
jgi:hypothetical protein